MCHVITKKVEHFFWAGIKPAPARHKFYRHGLMSPVMDGNISPWFCIMGLHSWREPVQRTHDESPGVVAKVHAVATAISEISAFATLILAHPLTIAIGGKAVGPHVHEVVIVYIALMIVGAYARTSRYGAVGKYRAYRDTGLATEEIVAYVAFVVAHESLAAVIAVDEYFTARLLDKLQYATVFLRR